MSIFLEEKARNSCVSESIAESTAEKPVLLSGDLHDLSSYFEDLSSDLMGDLDTTSLGAGSLEKTVLAPFAPEAIWDHWEIRNPD